MRALFAGFFIMLASATSHVTAADDLIVAGQWHTMQSVVMDEERPYAVYLPSSYETGQVRYPVIYVLDGDSTRFKGVASMVEGMSSDNLECQIPEAIIVAIPNSDRTRDLTPTHTLVVFGDKTSDELSSSGGADRFLDFFRKELIPAIDKDYRTLPGNRMLVGESYGGLFAAHAFLTHNDLFSDYLVTDATYIWDNNYLNRWLDGNSDKLPAIGGRIFFSFANNSAFGEMGATNMKWGQDFAARLAALPQTGLAVGQQYFEGESHGTVALLSWYYGLKFFAAEAMKQDD